MHVSCVKVGPAVVWGKSGFGAGVQNKPLSFSGQSGPGTSRDPFALTKGHHSHFGSRYKLGCCGHAGLFDAWFETSQLHLRPLGVTCAWSRDLGSGAKLRNLGLIVLQLVCLTRSRDLVPHA